jgi:hypothetical protein
VQYYPEVGLWMMMYQQVGAGQVVALWAKTPESWQFLQDSSTGQPAAMVDMRTSADLATYCCQPPLFGLPEICTDGEIAYCDYSSPTLHPYSAFYAPRLVPYVTDVTDTNTCSSQCQGSLQTETFTVSYLLSNFSPYNTTLMKYTVQKAPHCVPTRCL